MPTKLAAPKFLRSLLYPLLGSLLLLPAGCGQSDIDSDQSPPEDQQRALVGPPANWALNTSVAPAELKITANQDSGSGTTADVTLAYQNQNGVYQCTITGGVANGQSKSCVPALIATTKPTDIFSGSDWFYFKTSSSDGILVTTLSVYINGTWYNQNEFSPSNQSDLTEHEIDCTGCESGLGQYAHNCNACWADSDGHQNCNSFKVQMDSSDESTFCWDNSGGNWN